MSLISESNPPVRRRRGAELEDALLTAAWEEIAQTGYDDLTYDAIAERAQTSRAVLYRRWPTKRELARAAVSRILAAEPIHTPDTGSLRTDMIALLEAINGSRARLGILLAARLGSPGETALTLADVREDVRQTGTERMRLILDRARDRGEISRAPLPERVETIALDLLRHDLLLTQQPATTAQIERIIDEVFLPLAQRG